MENLTDIISLKVKTEWLLPSADQVYFYTLDRQTYNNLFNGFHPSDGLQPRVWLDDIREEFYCTQATARFTVHGGRLVWVFDPIRLTDLRPNPDIEYMILMRRDRGLLRMPSGISESRIHCVVVSQEDIENIKYEADILVEQNQECVHIMNQVNNLKTSLTKVQFKQNGSLLDMYVTIKSFRVIISPKYIRMPIYGNEGIFSYSRGNLAIVLEYITLLTTFNRSFQDEKRMTDLRQILLREIINENKSSQHKEGRL